MRSFIKVNLLNLQNKRKYVKIVSETKNDMPNLKNV